jgi:hypothetical protein
MKKDQCSDESAGRQSRISTIWPFENEKDTKATGSHAVAFPQVQRVKRR